MGASTDTASSAFALKQKNTKKYTGSKNSKNAFFIKPFIVFIKSLYKFEIITEIQNRDFPHKQKSPVSKSETGLHFRRSSQKLFGIRVIQIHLLKVWHFRHLRITLLNNKFWIHSHLIPVRF